MKQTTPDDSIFERLRARGEEMFTQVSAQLMANPQFVKAMQGALKGKEKLDQAVGRALKQMNIPTRSEFKRALGRIEVLEKELADVKSQAGAEKRVSGARQAGRKARAPKPKRSGGKGAPPPAGPAE